jgi:hypothetical protein
LLRFAVDREALMGQTPFPDVMEQVFHEVGIGSVLSLQKFWQHRIKDYHSYMLQVRSLRENWGLGVFIRIPQYLLDYAEHREQSEFNILFSWSQLCSIGLITDLATYQSLL